jgi:hypothetical protein
MEDNKGLQEAKIQESPATTRPQKKRNKEDAVSSVASSPEQAQQKRPRLTKEQLEARKQEMLERKISMAKERNTRVARIQSPLGDMAFNILRQFDPAFNQLAGKMHKLPTPEQEKRGTAYLKKAQELILQLSNITEELCGEVNYQYIVPQEVKAINAYYKQREQDQANTSAQDGTEGISAN